MDKYAPASNFIVSNRIGKMQFILYDQPGIPVNAAIIIKIQGL